MTDTITVTYKSSRTPSEASTLISEISAFPTIACDFEAAVKYTDQDIQNMKDELETDPPKFRRITLESKLAASALDHPSHTVITHLSVAASDSTGYVIIIDSEETLKLVLDYLVTTTQQQIWHNASYDFRQIQYRTKKFPLVYEDTQILAKTILNHVETYKAKTGLKELAGHKYGGWGISADYFSVSQMYEEKVLLYAATDACATFWLWNSIQRHIKDSNEIIDD